MATKTIEQRVTDPEQMLADVPGIANLRFSFVRAQMEALDAQLGSHSAKVDRMGVRLTQVEQGLQEVRSELRNVMSGLDGSRACWPRRWINETSGRAISPPETGDRP